jgi:aldose 1-epimerase
VQGTPFDFRKLRLIAEAMSEAHADKAGGDGFDHNYVLDTGGRLEEAAACVYHPPSGRTMEVYTTKPGLQLYTANYLSDQRIGRGSVAFCKHGALCLETQFYPDSPNKPAFPSPLLLPGQAYNHTTIYKFSIRD